MEIFRQGPPNWGVECKGSEKLRFSTNISLYFGTDARQSHSYYGRWIGNPTEAFEWYQFEWPSVTYNPDFKVTIIQHQITRKWYNIQLYLRRPTNRKSYYDLWNGAIFNDLERPLPPVSFFNAEYIRNVRDTDSFNGILIRTYLDLQWHKATSGLTATAELSVQNKAIFMFFKSVKNTKFVVTTWVLSSSKCFAPNPAGRAFSAPPDP